MSEGFMSGGSGSAVWTSVWPEGETLAAAVAGVEEVVGLAFASDAGLVWERLTNVAPAHVRSALFEIDGAEVQAVCYRAGAEPVLLWHSHTQSVEPSKADLEFFPDWLVDYGAVYHVPSGQTTLYNKDGVIEVLSTTVSSLLATQES